MNDSLQNIQNISVGNKLCLSNYKTKQTSDESRPYVVCFFENHLVICMNETNIFSFHTHTHTERQRCIYAKHVKWYLFI